MKLPASLPDFNPTVDRMRAGARRLAPYRDRARATVRDLPGAAKGLDAVATTWDRLVEAFCETIEGPLARWFPERRLVASTTGDGKLVLHRIVKRADGGQDAVPEPADLEPLAETAWTAIELRLRPEEVLRRTLSLPGASRDFLAPIIEHRLERLTPWRPDKVLYGYRLLEAAEPNTVAIELLATSRDIVAGPLAALREIGLAPTAIGGVAGSPGEPLGIDLQRGGAPSPRAESHRIVSRVALPTLAILVVAATLTGLAASGAGAARDETNAKLAKARRLLRSASLGDVAGREKTMLDAKVPDRAMVVLVDRLAHAIPANTFLRELAVTPLKVRLVGTSGDAPALIAAIETTGLRNVRFSSAITREKDGRDSFEISADRPATATGASQ